MKKLAIIITHPVQYYAPVFQLLHKRKNIEIKVFYTWGKNAVEKYDPGFDKQIKWDIPLLTGYPFEWIENNAKDPGSHHFGGIRNSSLNELVSAWQPDAVLIYGWAYQSHLKAMRYFKNKIPVLFRGDSTLLDEGNKVKSLVKNLFLKWVYRSIDHAFYVGTNNRQYFKKHGLTDQQLSFAPHAIDNERFEKVQQTEIFSLREGIGISKSDILILFAGKFEEKKNPLLLLEAFRRLNEKNLHLLFVGNGILEQELKHLSANLNNVHFLDFQNQSAMPAVYHACDLFCLPSRGPGETWGLAINEAMACSKPILSSDKAGAAVDLVSEGQNGYIFSAGSLENLIENLQVLTNGSGTALEIMGRCSRRLIDDWTFEKQVITIERIVNA